MLKAIRFLPGSMIIYFMGSDRRIVGPFCQHLKREYYPQTMCLIIIYKSHWLYLSFVAIRLKYISFYYR